MRRVTRKPPNTLTAARATAKTPMPRASPPSVSAAASMAPTMMIAEMALVTAMSGVCRLWETFQMTWKPMKQASTKTMKCAMKLGGA